MLLRFPWYPPVLAAAYILNLWIVSGVSFFAASRALAVAIVAVAVTTLVITLISRRPHPSAAVAALLFAALVSRGALGMVGVVVLALALALALRLWARVQRRPPLWQHVSVAMNVLSLLLLGVILIDGIQRGTYAALVATDIHQGSSSIEEEADSDAEGLPNLFILLLDGYPRTDALADEFGFDNRGFVNGLEQRGFEVATASKSNYPYTQATLISMLHMRPLHEIERLDELREGQGFAYPLLRQVANDNPVFGALRARGYRVIASSPGYEHVTLRQADVFLDDGSLNETERHLIRGTPIQWFVDLLAPDALADQHRQRILAGFETFEDVAVAGGDAGPIFGFIHVPSPHMPVVISQDGGLLPSPPSDEMFRAEPMDEAAREAYIGQLKYLNARTLASIDSLLDAGDAGAGSVVVVLSDHGAEPPALPGESWSAGHYLNFLAIRAEGRADLTVPPDTTPVNLFPYLFGALFDDELPTWPDEPFPWVDIDVTGNAGPS